MSKLGQGIPGSTPAEDVVASSTERLALAGAVTASAALVGWLLLRCSAGIDFTDEGFYLNWISNPSIYAASVTQFGFVYHPLYLLVGGDIVLLRRANILLTLGLGWVLFGALFQTQVPDASAHKAPWAALSLVLATTTLAVLYIWLPTPNYKTLALQSLLLAGLGILLAETDGAGRSFIGWVVLGAAGWLAFMAKPTTAAALALVSGAYLMVSGKSRSRGLLIPVSTALLLMLLSAWWIDGSIVGFALRLMNGAEDLRRLQAGHSLTDIILRFGGLALSLKETIVIAACALIIAVSTHLSFSLQPSLRRMPAMLAIVMSVASIWAAFMLRRPAPFGSSSLGLQFWAFPLGAGLAVLMCRKEGRRRAPAQALALLFCFFLFPFAHVFGTNENYWSAITSGVVFWMVVAVSMLMSLAPVKIRWWHLLPIAVAGLTGTGAILYASTEQPYRQSQPLRLQETVLRIPATGFEIRLSSRAARYVENLDFAARQNGFQVGDAMIDLTGHYPTAIYLLGAKSVGIAWTSGGYRGSSDMVTAALDRVPRSELKKSWLLLEPTGPRPVSSDILKRYGIDLANDYVVAGLIDSPTEDGPVSHRQFLLKPTK